MSKNNKLYIEKGFKDRQEYLKFLADEYNMPLKDIVLLSELLGKNEDFDGLVSALDDMCIGIY